VPLLLYEREREIEAHPLLDLLARPNPAQSSTDLLESWYGYLLVAGNAYLEAVSLEGRVRELHALRPDRMRLVPGLDGWPEAYEYAVGGDSVRFPQDLARGIRPILHLALFHPADDHYGMSPIEAAATAIDIHNAASRWNKALLDNSARPSGALVFGAKDGRLTAEQYARLKNELETSYEGAANAGRPMLLEGGLDWKSMSLSPRDMDFIEAKHVAAREIALALGVPPMLLAIPGDNTYSNYQEAVRTFWRQAVLPLVNRTAKALSRWLGEAYGGGLVLRPDLDAIEALSAEREALWARLERASFLSDDEKRTAVGYGAKSGGPGAKFNPYHDDRGRFTFGPGGGGDGEEADVDADLTDAGTNGDAGEETDDDELLHEVSRRRGGPSGTPAQEARLAAAAAQARNALQRLRVVDPDWRPQGGITSTIEGQIAQLEAVARGAEARLAEILQNALPGANPAWGLNRLQSELHSRGFTLNRPLADSGLLYENRETKEQIRIMKRPPGQPHRTENRQKFFNEHYYRYRSNQDQSWGQHVTIPNK
jgi:HK97 family phage portal protein